MTVSTEVPAETAEPAAALTAATVPVAGERTTAPFSAARASTRLNPACAIEAWSRASVAVVMLPEPPEPLAVNPPWLVDPVEL